MRADERDKATKVTLTEAIQVPGTVLPPGTYTFKLLDDDANRHIVQIFNEDRTKLITTILAIPNLCLDPADKPVMTYAERPVGQPVALEAWFYSGDTSGQQFVYPKARAAELSSLNHVDVPSTGTELAYPEETPATQNQTPEPVYSASAKPANTYEQTSASTPSTVVQDPAPTQASALQTTNNDALTQNQLPHTGSPLPLIGLLGSLLIAAAILLKLSA